MWRASAASNNVHNNPGVAVRGQGSGPRVLSVSSGCCAGDALDAPADPVVAARGQVQAQDS